jgi:hypothetical protein
MLTVTMVRKADRSGYSLHIGKAMTDYPAKDEHEAASYINKVIEREILRAGTVSVDPSSLQNPPAGRSIAVPVMIIPVGAQPTGYQPARKAPSVFLLTIGHIVHVHDL